MSATGGLEENLAGTCTRQGYDLRTANGRHAFICGLWYPLRSWFKWDVRWMLHDTFGIPIQGKF